MNKWAGAVIGLLYILPVFFMNPISDRVSSLNFIYLWSFAILLGVTVILLQGITNDVLNGMLSALAAGLLIGVVVSAIDWSPISFSLIRELVYLLAPLFLLYHPIDQALKNGRNVNAAPKVKREENQTVSRNETEDERRDFHI